MASDAPILARKRAESRARYYTRDEARRLGWMTAHPSAGGKFLEEQEIVDYFPMLRPLLGAEKPDFAVLDEANQLKMVIECKNDFEKIDRALEESKQYAETITKANGFDVRIAVGVAGTPDRRVQVQCAFRKNDGSWVALKSHSYELTQLPTLLELQIAVEKKDGTTDVELPDEREFFDAAVNISNILRRAKIIESDRPKVIGSIILALYQGHFSLHPEAVIEAINANVKAAVYAFADMPERNRELLATSLVLSTETRALRPQVPGIVQQLERLNVRSIMRSGVDFLGQFYEAFLRYGCDAKSMGIVFTPRHITRYCAQLVNVKVGMKVYDPACGTGGFLVAAFDKMWQEATTSAAKDTVKRSLYGSDTDSRVWALAVLNMFFRGDGKSHIAFKSCFDNPQPDDGFFDRVLLNPPFSQEGEPEHDFIDHALQKLHAGGELAVVVKTNVAVDPRLSAWRRNLVANHQVLAVISMPVDLFYPTAAPSVIMIIRANSPNKLTGTFVARIENDGYTIHKKRRVPIEGSQLDEVMQLYREYLETGDIETVPGVACVVNREQLETGEEFVAEQWLPSKKFTVVDFEEHKIELIRQITMAVTRTPEIVDELIEDYDALLANGDVEGRPTKTATIGDWFLVSDGNTKAASSYPGGSIPYISSGDSFNSVMEDFLQPPDDEVYDTPHITVTGFGKAHLQPWRFCARGGAGSGVRTLKPRFAMTMSEMAWFAAQINAERWRIFYGRMISQERLRAYKVEPPPDNLPAMSGMVDSLFAYRNGLDEFCKQIGGTTEEIFISLAEAWKAGRGRSSSATKLAEHPAYRQIIAMGKAVVPSIIRELEAKPDHWFIALYKITGVDPVPVKARGNLRAMANAWISWAKEQGVA